MTLHVPISNIEGVAMRQWQLSFGQVKWWRFRPLVSVDIFVGQHFARIPICEFGYIWEWRILCDGEEVYGGSSAGIGPVWPADYIEATINWSTQ